MNRGREPAQSGDKDRALTTGRGGAGNIYSSSMARLISRVARPEDHPQTASLLADREAAEAEYERSVIRASEEAAKARKQSSGRGGAGNIARSQSKGPRSKSKSFSKARRSFSKSRRSKSRDEEGSQEPRSSMHSVGRGGAGNIQPGSPEEAEAIDQRDNVEMERALAGHPDGMHSTGRGGVANITPLSPGPDSPPHEHEHGPTEHTGRGGAGNIFRTRSRSESKNRSNSRGRTGLGQIWQRVRSKSRAPKEHEVIALDTQLQDMTISEANTSRESMQVPQGSQAGASGDPPQGGQE